jgi:hypothetical protein
MADGIWGDGGRSESGGSHLEDFARRVRVFALDAHRILTQPDSSLDEVLGLHRTVWSLLREISHSRSGAMHLWLLAAHEAIGEKLRSWSLDDLESLVA